MKYKTGDTVRVVKGKFRGAIGPVYHVMGLWDGSAEEPHYTYSVTLDCVDISFTEDMLEPVEPTEPKQITLDVDDLDYDQVHELLKFFDKLKGEKK